MLKLSKKVEYAILAMQYMAMCPDELINAKQIAKDNDLSFEFLSKSLQILNRNGLINSVQGVRGGYNLAKHPKEITVAEIIRAVEQNSAIVDCTAEKETCSRVNHCIMKNPMYYLQKKIDNIFENTTVFEFTQLAESNLNNGKSSKQNFVKLNEIEIKN
jgi:Rrf2 family protein